MSTKYRTIGATFEGTDYHEFVGESEWTTHLQVDEATSEAVQKMYAQTIGKNLAVIAYDLERYPDGAGRLQMKCRGFCLEHVLPKTFQQP